MSQTAVVQWRMHGGRGWVRPVICYSKLGHWVRRPTSAEVVSELSEVVKSLTHAAAAGIIMQMLRREETSLA